MTQALAQFHQPPLRMLRPDLVGAWMTGFHDQRLAQALLGDKRLEPRVMADICAALGVDGQETVIPKRHQPVIAALMTHGPLDLATLIGCIWHRATVLDWITWNAVAEHLPGVDVPVLRRVLRSVPGQVAQDAGGPTAVALSLSKPEIDRIGKTCLAAWQASLAPEVAGRVALFLAPGAHPDPDPKRVTLVRSVAQALAEDAS